MKQVLSRARKVAVALTEQCNKQRKYIEQRQPAEKEAWAELCEGSKDWVNISCTLWGKGAGSNAW